MANTVNIFSSASNLSYRCALETTQKDANKSKKPHVLLFSKGHYYSIPEDRYKAEKTRIQKEYDFVRDEGTNDWVYDPYINVQLIETVQPVE